MIVESLKFAVTWKVCRLEMLLWHVVSQLPETVDDLGDGPEAHVANGPDAVNNKDEVINLGRLAWENEINMS